MDANTARIAAWLAAAYFVGGIPFGFLIGKMRGVDVRKVGSGNIGAKNVFIYKEGYGDVYYVFIVDVTELHLAREQDKQRANTYSGMIEQFNAFGESALAVFRANLSTETVEEVRGNDLYPTDYAGADLTASTLTPPLPQSPTPQL